jgi:alcohol dehydrogenase (cytochrome c)
MSLDPHTSTLFVATTNPAPDFAGDVRPGPNLYTNSLLALDVHTGALQWYRQLIPHDVHDWDLTQSGPVIGDTVITAGKDGVVRAIDRRNHEVVWETPVVTQKNTAARITRSGTYVCPGIFGGVLWNGPAYDPETHTLFVPSIDYCTTYTLAETVRRTRGTLYLGGVFEGDPRTWGGWITALDATNGIVRWRYKSPVPIIGGVAVTAGGVVLTGDLNGDFLALDAATGRVLHRRALSGPVGGGVVTFVQGGRQYIAIASGSASPQFPYAQTGRAAITVLAVP